MSIRRQLVQALCWGSFATATALMAMNYARGMNGPVYICLAIGACLWAGSELLRFAVLRRGWLDLSLAGLAGRVLLSIVLLSVLIQLVLFVAITTGVRLGWLQMPGGRAEYSAGAILTYLFNTAIMLTVWVAVWIGLHAWRKARQSELRAARAEIHRQRLELDALKARLNPHFVFNALNNLRALILEDPQRARSMVTRLSNTLRYALYHSQRERVPLSEELAVVEDYLAVEAEHYEQRLQVQRELDPASLSAELPPMLLQLLVENAIKHGIARTPGGGTLVLRCQRADSALVIEVDNPGQLQSAPHPDGEAGVGLAYLHARLQQHWPGASFKLEQIAQNKHLLDSAYRSDPHVRARLELPQKST